MLTRRITLLALSALAGCASAPKNAGTAAADSYQVYEGYLSDRVGAGGVVFLPCHRSEGDAVWLPSFNGTAREEVERLTRIGVLGLPKGAYVTLHGKASEFRPQIVAKTPTSRAIAVDAVRFRPGGECKALR